jgi:cytoskeletal protein CcmA (bactofilin family)
MFNSKQKLHDSHEGGTTIIGSGTIIQGDIESKGDIRIDGVLIGSIKGKAKILLGNDGVINGNIEGRDADILGKVTGDLKISGLLQLRGKCTIMGDIYTGKLEVEPTVTFNGSCHMGANVVEFNAELPAAINQ